MKKMKVQDNKFLFQKTFFNLCLRKNLLHFLNQLKNIVK